MSKKRPLPPVSYYRDADGKLVRNHREHRRHKAYGWYLMQTADVPIVNGKAVACQDQGFVSWLWGKSTPLQGTYNKSHFQMPLGVVACDDWAEDSWKPGSR
jgi:hypothetical protein